MHLVERVEVERVRVAGNVCLALCDGGGTILRAGKSETGGIAPEAGDQGAVVGSVY